MDPTYFTCTLGQAAELKNQQSVQNVNEFVEAQAKTNPDRPAVGFYTAPSSSGSKDGQGKTEWSYRTYNFSEILTGSVNTAKQLLEGSGAALSGRRSTVGLLCPSTAEFLFTWLGLMRLGHAVLLIAPQCRPAAIKSLCEQCEVSLLLHDEVYAELAEEAASHDGATITAIRNDLTSAGKPNSSQPCCPGKRRRLPPPHVGDIVGNSQANSSAPSRGGLRPAVF
jgi:acyl-CoA synthetase (AMP-forming)/AMP-acid ligase II